MLFYNLKGIYHCLVPTKRKLKHKIKILESMQDTKLHRIKERLQYYCNLKKEDFNPKPQTNLALKNMLKNHGSRYCYDLFSLLRYFDFKNLKLEFVSGDVNSTLPTPAICKSRPIGSDNNILLKLDSARHFKFLKKAQENNPYHAKSDILFFRGGCYQAHRKDFMRKFFDHPLIDAGHVGSLKDLELKKWFKGKASLKTHLKHKFILSLEGNDVATNLKWIMSSNSIAIAPKMKFETWFMEGKLIENIHYLKIKDDYSDLLERLEFIRENPSLASFIIHNANEYTKEFQDQEMEEILGILVLRKYFYLTDQIQVTPLEVELFS